MGVGGVGCTLEEEGVTLAGAWAWTARTLGALSDFIESCLSTYVCMCA